MAARLLANYGRFSRPFGSSVYTVRFSNSLAEQKPPQFPGVLALLKDKTGETGKLVFGVGVTALLFSKEIIVIHSETLVALSLFGVIYALMRRIGKPTAEYLDNRSQNILDLLNQQKDATIAKLERDIETERKVEDVLSCRDEVFEILKEESEMKREEEYRRRVARVRNEVKRRLDYQLQMEDLQRQFEQRHLISWLENSVREMLISREDNSIPQCLASLKQITASSATA